MSSVALLRLGGTMMNGPIIEARKYTLLQLVNQHRLTLPSLAHASSISVEVVRNATIYGMAIHPRIATQMLHGLGKLTGRNYTLAQVEIKLLTHEKRGE